MHGGLVTAESAGAGRGSVFEVSLPVPALRLEPPEPGAAAPPGSAASSPRKAASLTGLRVLVVEDDPDGREALTTVLEEGGAAVRTASSVEEALAAFRQAVPDVLISDIGLPERDGLSLMREIRSWPAERGGEVPALALTAYASAEDRQRTDAAGFQAYLCKPADPADLMARISALAGRPSVP
jgi:CheY-like chemotaxis protein